MGYTVATVRWAIAAFIVAFGAIGASPCIAQPRVASLAELRRELATGDFIIVTPAVGQPIAGRLMRLDDVGLGIRVVDKRAPRERGPRDVTLPLDAIQSLERPRDSTRNGAAIGAGIGAGFGGAMFAYAAVIDRNEIDEWAPLYIGAAAVWTGIGVLIGWATDAAKSKPHIKFDADPGDGARVRPRRDARGSGVQKRANDLHCAVKPCPARMTPHPCRHDARSTHERFTSYCRRWRFCGRR